MKTNNGRSTHQIDDRSKTAMRILLTLMLLTSLAFVFNANEQARADTHMPTADAFVRGGEFANTNYGTENKLVVRTATDCCVWSRWSYLKFDLSGVDPADVGDARLRLFAWLTAAGPISTEVFGVSNTGWSETGITWANKPTHGATTLDIATISSTSAAWYELDVTDYIQSELTAGRTTISLALESPDQIWGRDIHANSRQATSNKPNLEISPAGGSSLPEGHGLYAFGSMSLCNTNPDASLTSPLSWGPNSIQRWRDLEPSDNTYNWSCIDAVLAAAENADKRVVLRIATNGNHFWDATPDWFFALPNADFYQTSSAENAGIKLPVPSDPVFQAKFGEFLTVLGNRYNGNPNIEIIQTNAGGGVYGEMYMGSPPPDGWNNTIHLNAIKHWVDEWRDTFPNTNLTLMINSLGGTLVGDAAAYAVNQNFYLQNNSENPNPPMVDVYFAHQNETKIMLEIENGNCTNNTMPGFADLVDQAFSYGFPIDYLTFCKIAFQDQPTADYIDETLIPMLRTGGPGGV